MASSPRLSVVICTCNRYDVLHSSLEAMLPPAQTLCSAAYEVIVVDNTPADFRRRWHGPRPNIWHESSTVGLSNARNVGIELAKGEIIGFVDDDAIADPHWCEEALQAFDSNPEVLGVGGKVVPEYPSTAIPDWLGDELTAYLSCVDWGKSPRPLKTGEWIVGANMAFRRTVFAGAVSFNTSLGRHGDNDLLGNEELEIVTRLGEKNILYVPSLLVRHRIHQNRLTKKWFRRRVFWQAMSEVMMGGAVAVDPLSRELQDLLPFLSGLQKGTLETGFLSEPRDAFAKELRVIYIISHLLAAGRPIPLEAFRAAGEALLPTPVRPDGISSLPSSETQSPTECNRIPECEVQAGLEPLQCGHTVGIPILMYHSVADHGPSDLSPYRVSPGAFREQLLWLRQRGYYSVSLSTWANCVTAGQRLSGRPVIFTFDDGYKDFITTAAPMLEEFNFRATVFVVTGKVGGAADWDATSSLDLMNWDDLRTLQQRGFFIGSHTTSHADLLILSEEKIAREGNESRATLREQLGTDVTAIAYPWGRNDARVRAALARSGYTVGLAASGGHSCLADDLMVLPRIEIFGYDTIGDFARRIQPEAGQAVSLKSVAGEPGPVESDRVGSPGATVTVVITSCGRQDLLERTLDSFFAFNSYPVETIIVVEDGPKERNAPLIRKYGQHNITWIGTEHRVGQIGAIDLAYALVRTDTIFHLEDDWEFLAPGFIEKSLAVLQADPSCLQVWLRALDDTNGHPIALDRQEIGGVAVRRLALGHLSIWHGFSFNPGLRRTADYRRIGTYGEHASFDINDPAAAEAELSRIYCELGMYAVILADNEGRGYLRHIGEGRHIGGYPQSSSSVLSGLPKGSVSPIDRGSATPVLVTEANSMAVLDQYILHGGHRQVEGWIEDGALSLLMLLNQHQMNCDIMGAIAEIGVHHGRCFIALSAMRRPDEFGVAADIFENQDLNPDNSGHGDRARFLENLETFGVSDRQTILTQDSLTLSGKDIISAAQGRRIRLFSVDGSHTAKHTANDLKVAGDALASRGVIILDDWFNPDWPGVQEGFFAFARRRGCVLAPFAYGNSKLYLTRREDHSEYFDLVGRSIRPIAEHHKEVVLADFPCHHLRLPSPEVVEASLTASLSTELNVAKPSASAGSLGAGWSEAEEWGRWTVGPKADFTLMLPSGRGDLLLAADIATFFFGERQRQAVTVRVDERPVGEWVIDSTELERKELQLSPAFVAPAVRVELSFLTTQSPKLLGLSDDERDLGVRVSKFVLRRVRGGGLQDL